MTANYTARALSTNKLQKIITQVGHPFSVGNLVAYTAVNPDPTVNPWDFAIADSVLNCQDTCMVSFVVDADTFVVTQVGYVANINTLQVPLTVAQQYYLSETTIGNMTLIKPTTVGKFVLPCFVADTINSGYFMGVPGVIVEPPNQVPWETIAANQVLEVNKNYWINSGVPLTLSMAPTMGTSDAIEIACPAGGGGFVIDFDPGQTCDFVNTQTSSGGTITLTTTLGVMGGSIKINCHTTDTGFMVTTSTGNFVVA